MDYLFLGFAAYWFGQALFLLQLKAEHPDWQMGPCVVLSLAWPYVTARRYVVFCRAYLALRREARARAIARRQQ